MILNCAICKTEQSLTRQPSSVVQQKQQLKDTGEPKFHGKWFFHFKILENLLKLNLDRRVMDEIND